MQNELRFGFKETWNDYSALETATREGLNIGREEGAEFKSRKFVVKLISSTDFEDEKIALLVEVSLPYVQKIREGLEENKKV